jgi:hypothetical protein
MQNGGHRFESTRGFLSRCAVCGRPFALSKTFACSLCGCTVHRTCLQLELPEGRPAQPMRAEIEARAPFAPQGSLLKAIRLGDDAVVLQGLLWKRSRRRGQFLKQKYYVLQRNEGRLWFCDAVPTTQVCYPLGFISLQSAKIASLPTVVSPRVSPRPGCSGSLGGCLLLLLTGLQVPCHQGKGLALACAGAHQ